MKSSAASAINAFSFDMLKVLSSHDKENVFFSPLSIFTCLNMATLGAKGNTEKELFEVLRADLSFDNAQDLHKSMKQVYLHLHV